VADDAALEVVLRLVAEGRLTAEEAAPILDALEARGGDAPRAPSPPAPTAARSAPPNPARPFASGETPARAIRIEVTDAGRSVINLRVPLSLGKAAINQVPGISESTSERIREAIDAGIKGPIVDIDEDGDGVRISLE
jgi:SHOCT-like protein